MIVASELSKFLGTKGNNTDLLTTLTDLYDSPPDWTYDTIGRGKEELTNVCLSLLGGSTIEWLQESIPTKSIGGGFTSRLMMVYVGENRKRVAHPTEGTGGKKMWGKLAAYLAQLYKLQGPFVWDPQAYQQFEGWYNAMQLSRDPLVKGYYGRRGDHLLKLAMVHSLAETPELVLLSRHLDTALRDLERNEKHYRTMMKLVASTEVGELHSLILKKIGSKADIPYSELLRSVSYRLSARELKEALDTLKASHQINEGKSKTGRGLCYRLYQKEKK